MAAEERTGIEVFAKDEFSKVFREYDKGLARIESRTTQAARSIGRSGAALGDWSSGLESTFERMGKLSGEMDRAQDRARDMAAGLEAGEAALGGLSGALTVVGGVVTGVATALAALGAVGLVVWGRMKDAALAYVDANKDIQEAQEALNKEWTEAGEQLGQVIIPLKVELIKLETEFAGIINERTIPGLKGLAGIAYSTFSGIAAGFKEVGQIAKEVAAGQVPDFEASWQRIRDAGKQAFVETGRDILDTYAGLRQVKEEEDITPEPDEDKADESWRRVTDVVDSALGRIRNLQESHLLQMVRAEEDAAIARARAWSAYEKKVAKEIGKGEKSLVKLTEKYEKDRAETIEKARTDVVKAERKGYEDREKAERDFQRDMQHARERYNLDRLQSQRRYQYERNRLVAEGDTLAIEQLDEQFKLEQQEAKENKQLEEKQEKESFADRLRDMQQAANETLTETRAQLSDVLAEQEAAYQEQLQQQKDATAERLAEMAAEFADSQRMQDEDRALAAQRREEDYQRQLRELGGSLSSQLDKQQAGAMDVSRLLETYYGPGGVSDEILQGFHEREAQRIAITNEAMRQMGAIVEPEESSWMGWTGVTEMDRGGIVRGPAQVSVGAGMVEAFVPLSRVNVSGNVGVNVTGLESASQHDVSAIASALARELTTQVHALRRS